MLLPNVERYVVPPPSASGQNNQTVASTSATTALVLATLEAALMATSTDRAARQVAAPCGPEVLLRSDREGELVEVDERHGRREVCR